MDSDSLQPWQCEAIAKALFPGANYIVRLKARMERRGFRPDDPIYRLVVTLHDTMQALRMQLHYRSCESGVGRPPTKTDDLPST